MGFASFLQRRSSKPFDACCSCFAIVKWFFNYKRKCGCMDTTTKKDEGDVYAPLLYASVSSGGGTHFSTTKLSPLSLKLTLTKIESAPVNGNMLSSARSFGK